MSSPDEDHQSLVSINFDGKVTPKTMLAAVTGTAFVVAALLTARALEAPLITDLLLCSGIGIFLAAFGGQATVRGKNYVFAGVAAIVIGLFAMLQYQRNEISSTIERKFARGSVHQLPKGEYAVSLYFGREALGNIDANQTTFHFAVFSDDIQASALASLDLISKTAQGGELNFAIPVQCIANNMGSNDQLDWSLKKQGDDFTIVDNRNHQKVIGVIGAPDRPEDPCAPSKAADIREYRPSGLASLSGVSAAYAQQASEPAVVQPVDLSKLDVDLKSDDVDLRRGARDTLSNLPASQVPAILQLLTSNPNVYRTELGVAVALTQMLRRDKGQNITIRNLLTDTDRSNLLDLAGNPDRTISVYATEFLYDLGDPTVTKLAIERAASTSDDKARFNYLFAAQDGMRFVNPEDKKTLKSTINGLGSFGAKTDALVQFYRQQVN